eukprot:CAMPEP_0185277362 /NCGR_PEP_ID=MMETSP1359-20130426/58432_1 /TAXON_ID=552665 /ORGANISM="Bigelowiella longifila, Strain CCMP242" /LENGTH=321 /DNA_ID=CAMNT_0027871453 /DNA_START=55 /DNA_END=1020 /DNA_ORIENTATION=-
MQRLNTLKGAERCFNSTDVGKEPFLSILRRNSPVADRIKLRIGAQVLLVKNLDVTAGLVNGARGVVVRYEKFFPSDLEEEEGAARKTLRQQNLELAAAGKIFPVIRFAKLMKNGSSQSEERIILAQNFTLDIHGKVMAWREQVPLKLAWAISIHKSQGMTIDHLEVDMQGCFAYGQAYVALSRARSFRGLRLINFKPDMVRAAPQAVKFYQELLNNKTKENQGNSNLDSLVPYRKAIDVEVKDSYDPFAEENKAYNQAVRKMKEEKRHAQEILLDNTPQFREDYEKMMAKREEGDPFAGIQIDSESESSIDQLSLMRRNCD